MPFHFRCSLRCPVLLIAVACFFSHPAWAQSTPSPDSSTMMKLLVDFGTIQVASEGTLFRERTLGIGHLELYFKDGSLFPLKSRAGDTLGWFFEGEGRYLYRTVDAADRKALEVNLSRRSVGPRYQDGTVIDSFRRLVVFSPTLSLPALSKEEGAAAPPPENPPAQARNLEASSRSAFQRIWSGIGRTNLPYSHLAVQARMNGNPRYLLVETDGGTKPAGYEFDEIVELAERLFLLEDNSQFNIRVRQPLSRQSLDDSDAGGAPGLVLKDVLISVSTDDNHTATIKSDLTCTVGKDGLRVARLYLVNNRNPYSADWSSTRNQLRVRSVTDENGRPLPYSHQYHEILVELPHSFAAGEFVNLRFQTEGEILTGLAGREADNYFTLSDVFWFPTPDFWSQSGFTFSLNVRTRKPFRPVAMGTTTSFKEEGDFYELKTDSIRPVRSLAVFAGKYVSREEKLNQLTVRVHAYASARKEVLELLPKLAGTIVGFYEQLLGPYPYGELDIVEVPFFAEEGGVAFGIAMPGLVLMTGEAYHARGQRATEYFSRGVNARLAHEIAHQWFGATAVPMRAQDVWLSESTAEYLSGLAMSASQADQHGAVGFKEMFAAWRTSAKSCRDSGSLETAGELAGDQGFMDRTCLLYDRGPLVLHMLHTMSGNDQFFAILREYLQTARSGSATTQGFEVAAGKVLQQDLGWFFDSWYRKGGIPEIQVEHHIEHAPGKTLLAVRASQADGPGFKQILIPLILDFANNRREVRLLFQDKPVTEVRFELDSVPTNVLVDPGQNNLAVYRSAP